MGKIVICSKKEDYLSINENFLEFKENFHFKLTNMYVNAFDKLRIHVDNYAVRDNGFIIGVGTYIYKNNIGQKALINIFEDIDYNIENIQRKILGSYCIMIYKGDKAVVFVDPSSIYNIYFYLDNNRLVLTNTFYHIAKCIGAKPSKIKFMNYWIKKSVLENKPFFEGVNKLCGDKYLLYTNERWELRQLKETAKEKSQDIFSIVKEKYSSLPVIFNKTSVFMTGGQDSRMTLALMLHLGMKPTLYYGEGNSNDTATREDDKNIVKLIAEKFNLPFVLMNWRDSDKTNKKYYIDKYGEMFNLYYMNKNIFKEFEDKIDTELLCFGYFGEVYRTIESIETYDKEHFTLDQYIDDLYVSDFKMLFKDHFYKEIHEQLKSELQKYCSINKIDEMSISKDDFQKLNTVYRQTWDTDMDNFANQFFYTFPLFGNIDLIEYAENLPYSERYNSVFQMKIIEKLCPGIMDVPFFSHMKVKKYNHKTNELVDAQLASKLKDSIRSKIKSKELMKFARYVYYLIRRDHKALNETKMELNNKSEELNALSQLAYSDELDFEGGYNTFSSRDAKDYSNLFYLIEYIEESRKAN